MAAIKGHVVDLEVTPGITWSGPGDRKQPLQSWRCLQEICWHRDLSTLLSLYHTHRRARAHMFRNRAHKYAQCTHSHTNGQGKKNKKKTHAPAWSPHTGAHSGDSRVESAGETETLWPFNSQDLWTGQDHTHWWTQNHTRTLVPAAADINLNLLLTQSWPTLTKSLYIW